MEVWIYTDVDLRRRFLILPLVLSLNFFPFWMRRGWRKRRSIVVHQRYCWVKNRGMVRLQAIIVTPIRATEG